MKTRRDPSRHAASKLMLLSLLASSCGSPCGLALVDRVFLESGAGDMETLVACCGGFVYADVNLTGDIQVDLTNWGGPTGRIDAFLTTPDCTKLFDGPYTGTATMPLCKTHIGPIAPGAVSPRQTLPPGRYRMFAQAWTSNESPTRFRLDVGIWSDDCSLTRPRNPAGPSF